MNDAFQTFDDFWPYYVREHSKPTTRWMHFAGTAAALLCLTAFARTRKLRWLVAAVVSGYGPAWVSHFFVEKNRPATFKYPLWSLQADLKMFALMLRGQMNDEIARVTSHPSPPNGQASTTTQVDGTHTSNTSN
uniref:Hypothetical conserved protein n=1 Tax=uncultured delta proteobacterium TaxID=34034 RepID=H5SJD2_9DELT|nr:hypothetical conserved protein [uncultured delta proteobacterium]